MNDLFKRHYDAIVNRGLITPETKMEDFINKINEEFEEVIQHWGNFTYNTNEFDQELIDLAMTCFNCLIHFGVDIEYELCKNIEKQEKRAKNNHT